MKLSFYTPNLSLCHPKGGEVYVASANTVSRTTPLNVAPATRRPKGAPTESWINRCVVSCARRLHDLPVTFPILRKTFRVLQRAGINVTPNHFYWPVPDLAALERREWRIYSPPPACNFEVRKQMDFAQELASKYGDEWQFSEKVNDGEYHYNNGYFEAVDTEVAYGMVRYFKPNRIIEIGTGFSTRVLAAALQQNHKRDDIDGDLISVDPNPERFPANGRSHRVTQIPAAVQDVELELFDSLRGNDILFIDSSHVVATGNDVLREYLEILPRLKPGVVIHVHDIFLPSDYPRSAVLNNLWFWSEQYLLQAFLSFNPAFEVLWGSSAMQSRCSWILDDCFPNWRHSYRRMPHSKRRFVPTADGDRVWPSSFWMRRI